MKVKIGSIFKVAYPLFLGWLFFFVWRGILSEQIIQPSTWPFLIMGGLMVSICFGILFFSGFFVVNYRKDKIKYISIIAFSFVLSSITLMQSTDNFNYDRMYGMVEKNVGDLNENKDYLTSKPYSEFLEARKSLDISKLKEYANSIDSLVGIDKNLSITLVLVKETVTSFNVNDKLNEMNSDNFISKAEFNQFRDFVLQNSKGNERVALVMAH